MDPDSQTGLTLSAYREKKYTDMRQLDINAIVDYKQTAGAYKT